MAQYLPKSLDWFGCCLWENNSALAYLKISEWTSTSLHQEEPRPPCRVEPLFVFSPEDPVLDQRQQRSSGVSIITSLWWPSHSLFRQASHMYISHANVKHAQTHSMVRRALQIKHFATCASHLIPSGTSAHQERVYHRGESMRNKEVPNYHWFNPCCSILSKYNITISTYIIKKVYYEIN